MRSTFAKELQSIMNAREAYLLTGDLGFSVFDDLRKIHPKYFLNMGVAEQSMVGISAGLANSGKEVYVYSIVPFIMYRAFEQIRNDICYPNLPVRLIGVGAGLSYSDAGPTHHSIEDVAISTALPNLTVLSPSDPKEVEFFMRKMITINGPVYLRISKRGEPLLHSMHKNMKIGRALKIANGNDVLIVSTGAITKQAIETAQILEKEGTSCEILDLHTLKPFDYKSVINSARNKKLVVTVEENSGGLASMVALALSSIGGPKQLQFKLLDEFSHVSGSREYLLNNYGLNPSKMAVKIKKAI